MYCLFDSCYRPVQQAAGVVTKSTARRLNYYIDKELYYSKNSPYYVDASVAPRLRWRVSVRVGSQTGSAVVGTSYPEGAEVAVHYVNGRFTGKMYVKTITPQ